jgi:hypothetical protein
MFPVFLMIFIIAGGLLFYCGRQDGKNTIKENHEILATIDGIEITRSEFLIELKQRGLTSAPIEKKQAVLDAMMKHKAIIQLARAEDLQNDPKVQKYLERLLVNRYREIHLQPRLERIGISEQRVKEQYEKDRENFRIAPKRRGAVIVWEYSGNSDTGSTGEEQRVRILEHAEKIREKAMRLDPKIFGFGRLAKTESSDPRSRLRGGDMGWIQENQQFNRWPECVVQALFSLKEHGVSQPFECKDGVFLLKLVAVSPESYRSYKDVKKEIRARLIQEEKEKFKTAFYQKVCHDARVKELKDATTQLWTDLAREKQTLKAPPSMPD